MKKFNVTGLCVPDKHYMVNTEKKISVIMDFIRDGKYFTINRARQFGKTTTLYLIEQCLKKSNDYVCIRLSFEGAGFSMFETADLFCREFLMQASEALMSSDPAFAHQWLDDAVNDFAPLSRHISKRCKDRKIVLLIDEVDQASNFNVFLQFLGMLRNQYLNRNAGSSNAFHSVILAGVYDIKNIKLKLSNNELHTHHAANQLNSPWNIASKFTVDMFFNADEISTMLTEYENDHHTGMEISAISEEIFRYTGGYPYLVSRICQYIDEETDTKEWTVPGIQKAVKAIAFEKSVLYDDIFKNLEKNQAIYDFMYALLIIGDKKRFSIFDPVAEWCGMFGFIYIDSSDGIIVSNKIFEMILTDYFISKENSASFAARQVYSGIYEKITSDGRFNMELCLRKFAEHYAEMYTPESNPFLETHGRLIFLSFLKPLVNGNGFYHIESQFTDLRRMDVIIDYGREQFIVELKLWKGEKAQDKAYTQLLNYMESKSLRKGYLLVFDFRKEKNKKPKSEWINIDGREIFEVIV